MDLIDIIEEKRFLGQEFLTWILFKIESGGAISISENKYYDMQIRGFLLLDLGTVENKDELVCKGSVIPAEVMSGLNSGKKIEQAKLSILVGDLFYLFTLKATRLEFCGIKLPKTIPSEEDDTSMEGLILDRIGMLQEVTGAIREIFQKFLTIRIDHNDWEDELNRIRQWISEAI